MSAGGGIGGLGQGRGGQRGLPQKWRQRQSYNPLVFFSPSKLLSVQGLAAGSFVVDIVVRGEQDGRQFAGQADQGPVEVCLLLGFDFLRLPPKLFGPQDGGDTPPEPLGRLPLPHLVFGILHGHMLLPWDFLMWHTHSRGKREKRDTVHYKW